MTSPTSEPTLAGRRVSVTGRLAAMSRLEAREWIERCQGTWNELPTPQTDWLVVGDEGWPLRDDGHLTRKLSRAIELQEQGSDIRILTEREFLEESGAVEASGLRLYTVAQLARILGVPRDRLRRWVRQGLIEPVREQHRLALFDFRQVASAKALAELVSSGVPAERVRKSLEQLRRWHDGAASSLAQLALLEQDGRLLVRLAGGHLAEPSGQLQLEFEASNRTAASTPIAAESVDDPEAWFERALDHEDAGRLTEARDAYRRVLEIDPDQVEAEFNLGNVLYAESDLMGAVQQYLRAIDKDPDYVEAWNNLGIAYGDQDRWSEALTAFQRALAVEPAYTDAHYNLAESYEQLGRLADARRHWQQYLRFDPTSSWAREVREKLV